jgi:hypothetical protein
LTRKKPAYTPPRLHDQCFIAKTYGPWSSGTRVEIIKLDMPADYVVVRHTSTGEEFEIELDVLVRKRDRNRD